MAEHIDALDVLVRRYRWRQAEGTVEMHRGLIAHLTGRLDEAEASYGRAADMLHASGALDADGIALLAFLTLRITQGREAELADAVRGVDSAPDVIADLLALPLIAQGRQDKAREARRVIRPVRRDFFHCLLLTMRGMIVARLGERAEAAEVYADLLPYRGQIGGAGTGSFAVGPVDTVLGDLALLLDRPRDAREHFATAIRWRAVRQRPLGTASAPQTRRLRGRTSHRLSPAPSPIVDIAETSDTGRAGRRQRRW